MRILASAHDQIIGRRSEQQDVIAEGVARLGDGHQARLMVVADGMGGHSGGAIAAEIAVTAFLAHCEGGGWPDFTVLLRNALLSANRAIGEYTRQNTAFSDMGCTLIAAVFDGPRLYHISVGDSLLLCVADEGIDRLNADHSMAPLIDGQVLRGEMTLDEARNHPQRSALRSALTGRPLSLIDDGLRNLAGGEIVILASDGILSLGEARVLDVIRTTPEAKPDAMIATMLDDVETLGLHDQDNCSIGIVVMQPALPRSGPRAGNRGMRKGLAAATVVLGLAVAACAWWVLTASSKIMPEMIESQPEAGQMMTSSPTTPVRRPGVRVPPASAQEPEPTTKAKGPPQPGARNSVAGEAPPAKASGADAAVTPKATPSEAPDPKLPDAAVGLEQVVDPDGVTFGSRGKPGEQKARNGPQ